MRVVISAGGTGGHIYPALAIIEKIKEQDPGSEFLFIGTHNRMEKDIVPKLNIPFEMLEVYGFNRKHMLSNFKTLRCLIKAYFKALKLLKNFNPDIVIGVGGYVTFPVLKAAKKLKIKTAFHEQNSVLGLANKLLLRYADEVWVSFSKTLEEVPSNIKAYYTGNPCSEKAFLAKANPKSSLGIEENKKLVLIVMGSLGSSSINDIFIKILKNLENKPFNIIFVTGNNYFESFPKDYAPNIKIVSYLNEMTSVLKSTDLLISRAGATTISEVTAIGVPTIFIPSPYVPNNHQLKNALDLVSKEAALLCEEKDLGLPLINMIEEVINDDSKLTILKNNLKNYAVLNSATLIYENIRRIINERG